jgi:hypothetical protein
MTDPPTGQHPPGGAGIPSPPKENPPRRVRVPRGQVGWISVAVLFVSGLGFVAMIGYAWSTPGSPWTYFGVALLTALAAFLAGSLLGFLMGIPRAVSSGEVRQGSEDSAAPPVNLLGAHAKDEGTGAPAPQSRAARFALSTNLAEVSDWLTKLLLGAGLVSLTQLGEPLGALVHTVASGLVDGGDVTGAATTVAGATLVGYSTLGFVTVYIFTTVAYAQRLENVYGGTS